MSSVFINYFSLLLDKFSQLVHRSVVATQKFYTSGQTAEHGLKWTKCPAVIN